MNNEYNPKPLIIDGARGNHYRENQYAQNLLLKALSSGITDVKELKKIIGVKTATEVLRTLDKMQIRKEYHQALSDAGLDLNFIVGGIKNLCEKDGVSDKIKLGALQTILKSIGLDKYEKDEESGKNWEELILEIADKKSNGEMIEGELLDNEYEVNTPKLPEEVKKRQEEEKKAAEGLYD